MEDITDFSPFKVTLPFVRRLRPFPRSDSSGRVNTGIVTVTLKLNPCVSSNLKKMVFKIVMVRHGESAWNKENRFCGWFDADLSENGNIP